MASSSPPSSPSPAFVPTELVLSSGGTNGLAMLGALDALRNLGRLHRVRRIIGASVGGVIAVLLVAGYTPRLIFDVLLRIDFAWFDELDCDSALMFYDTLGAIDGRGIMRLLGVMLQQKGVSEGTTFAQLHARTGVELVLTGFNVLTSTTETFDHTSHPDMPVTRAVRITISIPLFFRPVEYGDQVYVDGGWMEPTPTRFCRSRKRTLSVSLSSGVYHDDMPPPERPLQLGEYLSLLFRGWGRLLLARNWRRACRTAHAENLVVVQLHATQGQGKCLDLEMTNERKRDIFAQGEAAVAAHAERFWPPKPPPAAEGS